MEQVGQPAVPVPIPIDEAGPVSDVIEWAQREIAAFTAFGQNDGIALSANSCSEVASWLRSLLTAHGECEATDSLRRIAGGGTS